MSKSPKGSISFDVKLNEEQKRAKALILENDVTVITGEAGCGKSLIACQVALDSLFRNQASKIIISRPAITADENLGFLPGDINDKLAEFAVPIMDNINMLYGRTRAKIEKIRKHIDNKDIEIVSIGHARGKSFVDAVVIIDEAQNLNSNQMKLILTRLGKNGKMIITGDLNQTDIKGKSGLARLIELVGDVEGLAQITLTENHRAGIVREFLNKW